jgi:hypothetical protein
MVVVVVVDFGEVSCGVVGGEFVKAIFWSSWLSSSLWVDGDERL